jgi:hypothetical protein
MQDSQNNCEMGNILVIFNGIPPCVKLGNLLRSHGTGKVQVLQVEMKPYEKPERFYERMQFEVDSIVGDQICVLPMMFWGKTDSQVEHVMQWPLPEGLRSRVIKVIASTTVIESSITIDNLACVIDSGLCKIPFFNPRTRVVDMVECPISEAIRIQRIGRVGRTRPGLAITFQVPGDASKSEVPELLRADLTLPTMLLSCVGLRYGDLRRDLLDFPPRDLESAGYRELQYLRILDSQNRFTEVGKKISDNWHNLEMLTPFWASVLFSWPRAVSKPYIAMNCLIISSIQNYRNYFTNFNKRVDEAFSPMSDMVTLINLLLPAMITRDYRGFVQNRVRRFETKSTSSQRSWAFRMIWHFSET